jgi:class 3 adenylate cyclase
MQVVARDAEKVRVRGGFGFAAPEFDEYPWVFDAPRRYQSVRVFRRGVLRRLVVDCTLAPAGGGTRVEYLTRAELIGGPVGAVARWQFRRRVGRGLVAVRALLEARAGGSDIAWVFRYPREDEVRARARPLVDALVGAHPADAPLYARLVDTIAIAPDADVARMRPYELAVRWGLARRDVLAACLRATKGGLLRLSWDIVCPSCEQPPATATRLADVPTGGHCPMCDVDFAVSFERGVEATFAPSPALRDAERLVFCHGSPMRTPHWVAQFPVEGGAVRTIATQLGAGRYRVQASGADGRALFDVDPDDGGARLGVTIPGPAVGTRPAVVLDTPIVRAGALELVVRNDDTTPHRVQVVHRDYESQAATAADVTALGVFRDLFAEDVLSPEQHVGVGRTVILFTDLVGSTALYERVGDAAAYGLVRRHFRLLFDAVERHRGAVVKTVGDCVMASFARPLDGARAGRAAIEALAGLTDRDGNAPGLALKVGVHVGPCLAIEANRVADYFGRTVNLAARVEAQAGPNEMVLSASMRDDPEVAAWLAAAPADGVAVRADRCVVKGVAGELEVVRVGVPVSPAAGGGARTPDSRTRA